METPVHITAILACYNRKAKTLACLQALDEQTGIDYVRTRAYLLDDGSTDGTGDAVLDRFGFVTLLRGDGRYFWNGGMRAAFDAARSQGSDFYLWLNDDTTLFPNAVSTLLQTYDALASRGDIDSIVIGSVCDPDSRRLTYGGLARSSSWHPLRFDLITPGEQPKICQAMHGNCVLIPESIAKALGSMDPAYTHSMGDLDYALCARKAGYEVWMMPGFAGTCATNPMRGTWEDDTLMLHQRWKQVSGPKGLPPREWFHFARKHAGVFWPILGTLPYIRLLLTNARRKLFPRFSIAES